MGSAHLEEEALLTYSEIKFDNWSLLVWEPVSTCTPVESEQ